MPNTESYQAQIKSFREEILSAKTAPSLRFAELLELHKSYVKLDEDLATMKYALSLLAAEQDYDSLKASCKSSHQQLKQQQKTLDDRTLAIEQKLYLGLPNDLTEMEKVIAEQESILETQQQINVLEEQLLEKMRTIDIEHGKKLADISHSRAEKAKPNLAAQEAFRSKTLELQKKSAQQTKWLSLLPIIILPIFLDVAASVVGLQKPSENHLIFSHYFFLIGFIIAEVFLAAKIKAAIAEKLSLKYIHLLLGEIEVNLNEVVIAIKKLEQQSGLKRNEILAAVGAPLEDEAV